MYTQSKQRNNKYGRTNIIGFDGSNGRKGHGDETGYCHTRKHHGLVIGKSVEKIVDCTEGKRQHDDLSFAHAVITDLEYKALHEYAEDSHDQKLRGIAK